MIFSRIEAREISGERYSEVITYYSQHAEEKPVFIKFTGNIMAVKVHRST
jgi:hypothetical protein